MDSSMSEEVSEKAGQRGAVQNKTVQVIICNGAARPKTHTLRPPMDN